MSRNFALLILLPIVFSCQDRNVRLIETATYLGLKEERLGASPYYVKIPTTMFLEEARGKEGQLGYGIWQIDSINRYRSSSAFIEIEAGQPVGEDEGTDRFIEKVKSHFRGRTINWRIAKTETNYFKAVAQSGKLTLFASSDSRKGLDSMISIVATFSSR